MSRDACPSPHHCNPEGGHRTRGGSTAFALIADDAADAVERAAREATGDPVRAASLAAKQLHVSAMEAVGQALNYGRTAGAMSAPGGPPTFAMRSEQLDRNTCPRCTDVHGTIVQADSPDFYALLPPGQCFGVAGAAGSWCSLTACATCSRPWPSLSPEDG